MSSRKQTRHLFEEMRKLVVESLWAVASLDGPVSSLTATSGLRVSGLGTVGSTKRAQVEVCENEAGSWDG